MAEGRFASVYSVEEFILEHENKNTAQKTERDVRLLERFLKTKDEDRKIEDIPAAELNEFISEFIISVRTKDGNEYEPTSLRSLMASFERHLKKKGYSASIINDLVFEKTRKVLQSKQKQLKKQGKGNKPKASVALTTEELKTLYAFHRPICLLKTTRKNLSTYEIKTLQYASSNRIKHYSFV